MITIVIYFSKGNSLEVFPRENIAEDVVNQFKNFLKSPESEWFEFVNTDKNKSIIVFKKFIACVEILGG